VTRVEVGVETLERAQLELDTSAGPWAARQACRGHLTALRSERRADLFTHLDDLGLLRVD
jgi:hypothetical protein